MSFLGPFVFGGACVVQGALVAALLLLVLFAGNAVDPLGRLVAASAISLQSILALTLTFVALQHGRFATDGAYRRA